LTFQGHVTSLMTRTTGEKHFRKKRLWTDRTHRQTRRVTIRVAIACKPITRSQAVARIADRTASQHGGHVTSSITWPF